MKDIISKPPMPRNYKREENDPHGWLRADRASFKIINSFFLCIIKGFHGSTTLIAMLQGTQILICVFGFALK